MIKLFGNPKREKARKDPKSDIEMKAAADRSAGKDRKKTEQQQPPAQELFWDGYSDIGYC